MAVPPPSGLGLFGHNSSSVQPEIGGAAPRRACTIGVNMVGRSPRCRAAVVVGDNSDKGSGPGKKTFLFSALSIELHSLGVTVTDDNGGGISSTSYASSLPEKSNTEEAGSNAILAQSDCDAGNSGSSPGSHGTVGSAAGLRHTGMYEY
ncbi:hypothetical protein J6590_036301 [Homalodisca vitripennis]|nr:hypothetical protein J6590_036301 [Homalodisca vitripennis]